VQAVGGQRGKGDAAHASGGMLRPSSLSENTLARQDGAAEPWESVSMRREVTVGPSRARWRGPPCARMLLSISNDTFLACVLCAPVIRYS
jgi:hypothetical protein